MGCRVACPYRPRRTPCPHCPPLCRRNRAPCTLAQSYRQRLPILIYGRTPVVFQVPNVRRLIGNFVSNSFSSMKARSPLAFSVKSSMPPFKPTRPGIIAVSSFAPPGDCRCRAGLDAFSPQAACSTVSRAAGCPTNDGISCCSCFIHIAFAETEAGHTDFNRQSPRPIQYRAHLQGALALRPGGGRCAPAPRPQAKESLVTLTRATIAFAFYRCHPMADCRHCFYPTVGDMPLFGRNSYHARRQRGGLIVNTTLQGRASKPWGTCPS